MVEREGSKMRTHQKKTPEGQLDKKATLFQLATQINALAVETATHQLIVVNKRVEMGKLLYEAQKRISTESNLDFSEWCKNYIKKPDGVPFSFTTIKNYIRFARYPKTLASDQKQKKDYQERVRSAARTGGGFKSYGAGRPSMKEKERRKIEAMSVADQVNALVTAWDKATNEARKQFMTIASLKED